MRYPVKYVNRALMEQLRVHKELYGYFVAFGLDVSRDPPFGPWSHPPLAFPPKPVSE